jgi:hypothetical protein
MGMKRFIILVGTLFSINAHALFCPNSFTVINMGDATESVQAACGAPASERTYASDATHPTVSEWEYIKPNRYDQFTSKVTFLMHDNRVANITIVNGNEEASKLCQAVQLGTNSSTFQVSCNSLAPRNVNSTILCGGTLRVGDSDQVVQFVCGKPIATHDAPGGSTQAMTITEYTYSGSTPMILIFENGHLKEKR